MLARYRRLHDRPIAVSILVYGDGTPQGQAFEQIYYSADQGGFEIYKPIDVRTWFPRDPTLCKKWKVTHYEDAETKKCQHNLHNTEGFFDAVMCVCCVVDTLWNNEINQTPSNTRVSLRKILPVKCTAGLHRSYGTVLASQKRVLNVLERDGTRMYSCNVFSLHGVKDVNVTLASAQAWLTNTWGKRLIPPEPDWGMSSTYTSELANFVWDAIGSIPVWLIEGETRFIDERCHLKSMHSTREDEEDEEDEVVEEEVVEVVEVVEEEVEEVQEEAVREVKAEGKAEPEESDDSWGAEWPEAAPSGHAAASASGHRGVMKPKFDKKAKAEAPWAKKKPTALLAVPADAVLAVPAYAVPAVPADEMSCPCCKGHGSIPLSSVSGSGYISWDRNPDDLHLILTRLGCDEFAIAIAVNYVKRVGDEAFDEVNDVIHNLIKNWKWIVNASAFVTDGVVKKKKERFPKTW